MSENLSTRDALFDNLKGFLIFTVILGHAFEFYIAWAKPSTVMDTLYFIIYSFHMPFFVFISGYFSKNLEKGRDDAFSRFLLPFFLFNIIFYVYRFISAPSRVTPDFLLTPLYTFWYLLAMYLWRTIAKDLKRTRLIIPIAFALGLWVGTVSTYGQTVYGQFMSMSRFFVFLPFFVLGLHVTPEMVDKLRKFIRWPVAIVGLSGAVVLALYLYYKTKISFYMIFNSSPYSNFRLTNKEGVMFRALLYVTALLFIIFLTALFPRKKTIFTVPGQRSLQIFVLHSFAWELIPLISRPSPRTWQHNTWQNAIVLALVAAAGLWLFSRSFFEKLYNAITGTLVKIIIKKEKVE